MLEDVHKYYELQCQTLFTDKKHERLDMVMKVRKRSRVA